MFYYVLLTCMPVMPKMTISFAIMSIFCGAVITLLNKCVLLRQDRILVRLEPLYIPACHRIYPNYSTIGIVGFSYFGNSVVDGYGSRIEALKCFVVLGCSGVPPEYHNSDSNCGRRFRIDRINCSIFQEISIECHC